LKPPLYPENVYENQTDLHDLHTMLILLLFSIWQKTTATHKRKSVIQLVTDKMLFMISTTGCSFQTEMLLNYMTASKSTVSI